MIYDITQLIASDREKIDKLFLQFEYVEDPEEKAEILKQLCSELLAHRELEEKIIFPSMDFEDDMFVPKNIEEHEVIQYFVDELCACSGEEENLECKVKVLAEFFRHHAMLEERELITTFDSQQEKLKELGEQVKEFKSGSLKQTA
jgi:hypothetical protein